METYYRKQNRPSRGIRSYEDFREMLEKEPDIQGVVNITPDHQHASINISALKRGRAAISHKPVASVLYEVRRTVRAAREATAPSHLLAYSNSPDRHTLAAWLKAGVIGHVREVHNWTDRPFWPQGMQEYYQSGPPVPAGFNWSSGRGPNQTVLIIRATRSRCTAAGMRTEPAALGTWATTVCGSRTAC